MEQLHYCDSVTRVSFVKQSLPHEGEVDIWVGGAVKYTSYSLNPEAEIAIDKLRRYGLPGVDQIPVELEGSKTCTNHSVVWIEEQHNFLALTFKLPPSKTLILSAP